MTQIVGLETLDFLIIREQGLEFDNGFQIEAIHNQDCCENVYADFEHLKTYNILPHTGQTITIFEIDFNEDIAGNIEGVKSEGFNMVAKDDSRWFVPCYNSQNGYYSSDLRLEIRATGLATTIDISDYVKDNIY